MPPEPPPHDGPGYDATTKFLHWVTAALIITQFGLGELWDVWPDHSPTHVMMKSLHYSLGVVLAAVILAHILWRAGWGRYLPPAALAGWIAWHAGCISFFLRSSSAWYSMGWAGAGCAGAA